MVWYTWYYVGSKSGLYIQCYCGRLGAKSDLYTQVPLCGDGRLGAKSDLYTQVPLCGDGRLGLKGDLHTQVPLYDTCGPYCTDTDTDTMYTRTYVQTHCT